MTKQEFLAKLSKGLSGIPQKEADERLTFYSEIIDDKMEEGLSEEDAVCEIGNIDEIISQIIVDIPLTKSTKEITTPNKKLKVWEIVLLILGSPVWFSLLIAAFAIIISLYFSLWSVIISLWAVFISLAACSIGGVLACIIFTVDGNGASGVAMFAAGIVCAGLSVFLFLGCNVATKGILIFTKKIAVWIKKCFIKKEEA